MVLAKKSRIRLVLLDDHLLFRESLARLLASEHEFELVAECTTPAEALKSLKDREADVILVDAGIAKEFIPAARKARYPGKALVIASEIDAASSAIVLKCGAAGIFLASDSSSRLFQAIRLVAHGEAWLDQKVIQLLAERYPNYEDRWFGTLRSGALRPAGDRGRLIEQKDRRPDWRFRIHHQSDIAKLVQQSRRPNQKSACEDRPGAPWRRRFRLRTSIQPESYG
jgi:DNA-binding NarL/FixJ family response regulator